ncbi:unnamed protein product [Rhizoctonia solani]|uniref:F-box domain-containing protein n=1 Tax=Rhizoctonia solani TaxID=456999 RepID=A0A8H2WYW4_9AGAM|nr:unnamed protein product [Rhizoctonia solani]CAE6412105.1 unnamed protein product [Rhizoctonia solani]
MYTTGPLYISFSTLPIEVQSCVFEWLPLRDLASASMVSQAWRNLVFPYLNRTIHIYSAADLATLASRVALDDGRGPLSVVKFLRRLSIGKYTRRQVEKISPNGLVHLEMLIPQLVKLKSLYWNVRPMKKYMKLLQAHCPVLDNIELTNLALSPAKSEHYTSIFDFSNLSHISITFPYKISFKSFGGDLEYLPPLTRLLTSSPGLISLELKNSMFGYISTVNIVSSLGNTCVFPRLRVFRICWANEDHIPEIDNSDWNNFFTSPNRDSHPLRSFFLRHQGIDDLALGWSPRTSYEGKIDPNETVDLFPSLKNFQGPAFLCNAITKSDIAQNLETITVIDCTFNGEVDWLGAMADGLRGMPKLRSLHIATMGYREVCDPRTLKAFALAAPGMEDFWCVLEEVDFAEILRAVSHAQKLRKLVVDGLEWLASALDRDYDEKPTYEDWKDMISRLASQCRSLEWFECGDGSWHWRIVRDEKGNFSDIVNVH